MGRRAARVCTHPVSGAAGVHAHLSMPLISRRRHLHAGQLGLTPGLRTAEQEEGPFSLGVSQLWAPGGSSTDQSPAQPHVAAAPQEDSQLSRALEGRQSRTLPGWRWSLSGVGLMLFSHRGASHGSTLPGTILTSWLPAL